MHQDKAELYVRIVPFTNADHKRISRNKNNPLQRIKVSNNTTLFTISSYIHGQASVSDQNQLSVSLHVPFSNKCVQLPLSMSVADFLLITNQVKQGELRYRFDKNDEQNQQQRQLLQQSQASLLQNQTQHLNSIATNQIIQNSNAKNNLQYQKSNLLNSSFNNEQNYQFPSINPPSGTYTYEASSNISSNNFSGMNQINSNNIDSINKISFASNPTNSNDNPISQQDSPPTYPLPDFQQPSMGTDSNNSSIFHSVFHMFSNSFNSFPPIIDSLNYSQLPYEPNQNTPSKESISLKNDLEQILRK